MSSSDAVASWKEHPAVGRTFVTGCMIGAALAFSGVLFACLVGGMDAGPALGLAVFSAFWGGIGFGGMLGGAAGLIQAEALEGAEAP